MTNNIQVITDYPVALDSPDHIHLAGTASDNTQNRECNDKIKQIFGKEIKVLDLGCSGGGFVYDLLQDGHTAIGLEGSDYSKRIGRAYWPTLPNNLFTCDISRPFTIMDNNTPMVFDLITAWELMEHFKESSLDVVMSNISRHLVSNGIFMASIANINDIHNPVHQNVQSVVWWINKLEQYGFVVDKELNKVMGLTGWLRGPWQNRRIDENGVCCGSEVDTFCSVYRKI